MSSEPTIFNGIGKDAFFEAGTNTPERGLVCDVERPGDFIPNKIKKIRKRFGLGFVIILL